MRKLAVSVEHAASRLWRERWNALAGAGLFALMVLIVKWIGG